MVEREVFEELVEELLEEFPERFRRLLENLAVVVEEVAPPELARRLGLSHPLQLLGLYTGVPFTEWGRSRHARPPDTIRIYRLPILAELREEGMDRERVKERVREVILHEVGHRAGLGEEQLRDLSLGSGLDN